VIDRSRRRADDPERQDVRSQIAVRELDFIGARTETFLEALAGIEDHRERYRADDLFAGFQGAGGASPPGRMGGREWGRSGGGPFLGRQWCRLTA
jgi:hypothetical protein